MYIYAREMNAFSTKTVALWPYFLLSPCCFIKFTNNKDKCSIRNFDYPKFVKVLDDGHIKSVTFNRGTGEIEGEVKPEFEEIYKGSKFTIYGNTR
ncbi:MAG: hypothetical protein R2827_05315 [Bdellovibrionales bacterium]